MRKGNTIVIGIVIVAVIVIGAIALTQRTSQSPSSTPGVSETVENEVLAGKTSIYKVFDQENYEKALTDGKIVFLNFYANWCPTCRAEQPDTFEGFNKLTNDQIVGFRVNFNDTETSEDEKALAKEFGITYQHTKVILKNGKRVLGPVIEQWDSEMLIEELNKLL